MINDICVVLGCVICFYYAIYHDTIFILSGILILISYFFSSTVLESLYFLLKERIYGEKNLEEENSNQKKDLKQKKNRIWINFNFIFSPSS